MTISTTARYKSEFLSTMAARGFFNQCTDDHRLDEFLCREGKDCRAYIGFDATADSLHVGSLVQIMMLRWWQRCGHHPIVLLGGGTTRIGDPSGRDRQRPILEDAVIDSNKESIREIFDHYLDLSDGKASVLDNHEWLGMLSLIPFMREIGINFSINRMLSFDSVRSRLQAESGLSYLEFSYMILQAYDFVTLYRREGCVLQMGGADQWGNIVCGVDLGRRLENANLFGLTSPLLTTASGAKMGKTASGAVWLGAHRLSSYALWQYWRNVEDNDVGRFLRLFTMLPLEEIRALEALGGREVNEAKKILATEIVALCRGQEAAERAAQAATNVFEKGATDKDLPSLELEADKLVVELLVELGLCASRSAGRRLIAGGGAYINGEKITDPDHVMTLNTLAPLGAARLSVGRKRHGLVRHPRAHAL